MNAFPIWAVNLNEVKDVLPFKKELFDVVIIDEATQCDMATCIPLLQRAKRAVFSGDQNQLRHVSFLSRGLQASLFDRYNLPDEIRTPYNYRDRSMLDLVIHALQDNNQVAMLDEHFRSLQPIIAFSNKHFYDDELRIMTTKPEETEKGQYLIKLEGNRAKSGINEEEAKSIIEAIKSKIKEEQDLSSTLATSIGVLSPFRDQSEFIAKKVMLEFTDFEINKHQIKIGTAYTFQGEERDEMHLSFCVDNESHHSAYIHLNKPEVFNVSITRARFKQFNYLSASPDNLQRGSLFAQYINSIQEIKPFESKQSDEYDLFLEEVITSWSDKGIKHYWKGIFMAGMIVDLVIKYNDRYIGVDLIGYPGAYNEAFGIERYRILKRAGLEVYPLPYSDWYFDQKKTTTDFFSVISKE